MQHALTMEPRIAPVTEGRRPGLRRRLHGTASASRPGSTALPWAVATFLALAAFAATSALRAVIAPTVFLFSFAAVALSAWFGGLGPGLLTTLVSAGLARAFILTPAPGAVDREHLIRLLIFVLVGALVSFLSESMQRARAAFAAVIQASPLSIFSFDAGGRVQSWNAAAQRMFGWSEAEVLEQPLPIVPGSRREESRELRERVLAGETLSGLETLRQRRDGTTLDVSVSTAPLRDMRGRISGVMEVVEDITERKRMTDALHAAEDEARKALDRERRIAIRFQAALLPARRPAVNGFALAHTYRPALIEADVGGDFYNLFDLDDHHLVLAIGDVGGKGLDAAVVAARMQYSVTALALHEMGHPDVVLDGVHRVFEALADPDRIATLFLAILNRETGELEYTSAGHEPGILWRERERHTECIEPNGPALIAGIAGDFPAARLRLEPGDALVLFTDGLPDAHRCRGAALLGIERLATILADQQDKAPPSIVNAFYRAAVEHSEGNLRDDIALLALRRLPCTSCEGEYVFVEPPPIEPTHCPLPGAAGRQVDPATS